jgi:hypothetical protein
MVGNISDMKPDIATRQIMLALNGMLPQVKRISVGRYMTPRQVEIAPTAKTAIIRAGLKYFIRKVETQRQTMKSTIPIV